MKEINSYGYVHWAFSFFQLDERTHEVAKDYLWECLTSNANIYYHKAILQKDISNLSYVINIISKTKSSIILEWRIYLEDDLFVTWIYTFVKIKKES